MKKLITLLLSLLLAACAGVSPAERRMLSQKVAEDAGWRRQTISTSTFDLAIFVPPALKQAETFRVYIEGDGLAWVDSATPSFDPTPRDPLALKLAVQDGAPAVYLARPCQYVVGDARRNCENKYWTSHRFAPEVIAASNEAIDALKARYDAQRIELVGYSGGAAVAVLVAARRSDVTRLITVAGNLDTEHWARLKHLASLNGSLNPADVSLQLVGIPQWHFSGENDPVIPPEIAQSWSERDAKVRPQVIVVPGFDHHCCWVERWPELLRQVGSSR